jgi:hypothetical protein
MLNSNGGGYGASDGSSVSSYTGGTARGGGAGASHGYSNGDGDGLDAWYGMGTLHSDSINGGSGTGNGSEGYGGGGRSREGENPLCVRLIADRNNKDMGFYICQLYTMGGWR